MKRRCGPYVGVTGFTSQREVETALALVPYESTHRFMVGVLMNSRTLEGRPSTRSPCRYPKRGEIKEIFTSTDDRVLRLVHYNTENPDLLLSELVEITELLGTCFDGFQLNMAWPSVEQVRSYRELNPDKTLVLQIGSRALKAVISVEHLVARVGAYVPMIDAILFDESGGTGKILNPVRSVEHLLALEFQYSRLGLGVAGGLSPDNPWLLDQLFRIFRKLSVDAEDRLRTPLPEDALYLPSVMRFIESMYKSLGRLNEK
ncbi:MAG: hypothetical protein WDZ64_00635 [Parcubacteria group bacterium]